MILFDLFTTFFAIGLFSIGGGHVSLTLIKHNIVDVKGWLTLEELTDIITISEVTPGPVAINAATFVGTKIDSIPGAVTATIGFVAPSIIIVLIMGYIYRKFQHTSMFQGIFSGIRPAIVAMIGSVGLSIALLTFSNGIIAILLFALAFILLQTKKASPIIVMFITGIIGIFVF